MQGLNVKHKECSIHSYIFIISCGIIFGALLEALYHERAPFVSAVIMGIYFAVIHRINRTLPSEPTFTKALLSVFAITALEFLFGIVLNRIMLLHLWNYSDSLFHILGQICPRHSFINFVIAFPALKLSMISDAVSEVIQLNGGFNEKEKIEESGK